MSDPRLVMDAFVVVEREGKRSDFLIGKAYDSGKGVWVVCLEAVPPSGRFELRETEETRKRKAAALRPWERRPWEDLAYRRALRRQPVVGDPSDFDFGWVDSFDWEGGDAKPPEPPMPRSGPWVGPMRPWPEQRRAQEKAERKKAAGVTQLRSRNPQAASRKPRVGARK